MMELSPEEIATVLQWRELVEAIAVRRGFDEMLVLAMIAQESRGRPGAWNPEPRYRWLVDWETGEPYSVTDAQARMKTPPSGFPRPAGVDADAEFLGQQASWGLCVDADEAVASRSGYVPLREQPSSSLDVYGKLSATSAATRPLMKECLSIVLGLNLPIRVTADHRVLGRKTSFTRWSSGKRRIVSAPQPEWIPASELSEWDFVACPRHTPTLDQDVVDVETYLRIDSDACRIGCEYERDGDWLVLRYKRGRERSRVRAKIPVGRDLLELCGFYIAEGHRLEKGKGCAFSFHRAEVGYQRRVKELADRVFGVDVPVRVDSTSKNGVQVVMYGPGPRLLTELVPGTATSKHIPEAWLWLPPNKLRWLIYGAFCGDGCFRFAKYTTASRRLAREITLIFQRLGIVARLSETVRPDGARWYDIGLNSHANVQRFNRIFDQKLVEWPQTEEHGLRTVTRTAWRTDDDFIYFPVRSVRDAGPIETMDLQVPSSESFVVGRSVVHNCQIMGAVARERGFRGTDFGELCEPWRGVHYAVRHLEHLRKRFGDGDDLLATFNGGPAAKGRNRDYVAAVHARLEELEASLKRVGENDEGVDDAG